MKGAVYLLSRQVEGDSGQLYMQNVTVFAASQREATELVLREFARIRRIAGKGERAYSSKPGFSVQKVTLDQPKLITNGITT